MAHAQQAARDAVRQLQQTQGGTMDYGDTESQLQQIMPPREGAEVVGPPDPNESYGSPMGMAKNEYQMRNFGADENYA